MLKGKKDEAEPFLCIPVYYNILEIILLDRNKDEFRGIVLAWNYHE